MSQHGTFYVITAKQGIRPNRLKTFLLKEWLPALHSSPGCLDLELWESQRSRGHYLVCELWESKEIGLHNFEKLWKDEILLPMHLPKVIRTYQKQPMDVSEGISTPEDEQSVSVCLGLGGIEQ